MISVRDRHDARVEEIASEYESKGYEVNREPGDPDLLNLLGGRRPDLVATRGDDRVVIEVRNRAEFLPASTFRDRAERLRDKGGWRFLLFSCDPLGHDEESDPTSPPPDTEQIRERLFKADRLAKIGEAEAAFLMSWSSLEAAARRYVLDRGVPLDRFRIVVVLKHLYSEGVLTWEDLQSLQEALTLRNGVVHGLNQASEEDLSARTQLVMRVVNELLRGLNQS